MVPVVRLISLVARLVGVLTKVIGVLSTVIVSLRTKLVVSEFVPAAPFNSVEVEICAGVGVALLFLLAPVVVASPKGVAAVPSERGLPDAKSAGCSSSDPGIELSCLVVSG